MKPTERKSLGTILAVVLWAMIVLVGYYYIHKPISPTQAAALLKACLDIALAIFIAGLSGGLGRRLFSARALARLERMAVQAALGLGLLGISWLLIGLLNGYDRLVAWGMLILGTVVLRREIWEWCREFEELRLFWNASSVFGKTLAVGDGFFIGLQLLYALAPPLKWDSLIYHLQLPRLYLAAGRFEFIPSNPHWGYPQLAEMVYTWGMSLRGVETATTISWVFMGVLILGVLGLVTRLANSTAGWIAITALMCGYSFRGMMSWGYIDGFVGLIGLASFVILLAWLQDIDDAWMLWFGVLAGLAVWTKLTAGLLLLILWVTFFLIKGLRSRQAWKCGLMVSAIALFVFTPWLLLNGLATGNPIYPHLRPTAWTPVERLSYFTIEGSAPGLQALWLPLALTWYGLETGEVEGVFNYYSDFGPLLLLFAALGIFFQRKKKEIRLATIWLLVGWITMVVGGLYSSLLWQSRYYFILLPIAAVASGYGWQAAEGIAAAGVRLRRPLIVCVILVLGLNLWSDAINVVRNRPAAVILGEITAENYLDANLGWYASAMRALDSLPEGTKTLLLWEPRGFYAPLNAQPDVWIDRWYLDRRKLGKSDDILHTWQDQGFTHLLVYKSGAEFEREHRKELSQQDWRALDNLLSQLARLADFGGAYQLYSLNP